ncbi:EAL domain-containing protein [Haploplasma axanthum]|nr:EAL domain-containing protein [Haploplasma axanthum]
MKLSDILKLNNEIESLNIIQDFLNQTITQNEYEAAIAHYLKIASANKLDDLVLSEGSKHLGKIEKHEPTKYRERIYKYLIRAAINKKDKEKVLEYLNKRKKVLPILKQYLILLDELNFKKAFNEDYFDVLKKLSIEILPQEIKNDIQEQILNYYLENNMYEDALKVLNELKEQNLKQEYDNILLKIKYELGKYDDVIELGNSILDNSDNKAFIASYMISSLTKQNLLRKASILEAEYETIIDETDDEEIKRFAYQEIIKLYQLMNNNFSTEIYEKKLKKIIKKPKKEEKQNIQPIVKEIVKINEVSTTKLISNAKYLEHFEWIREWLIKSHKLDSKLAFREYLREIFILINEKINFKEVVLYLDDMFESNFFNYKKTRLYDKKIIKQYIDDSVIFEVLNKKDHIFGNPSILLNKKDVLTQKNYEDDVKYVYAFYINDNAALVFYLDNEFDDPGIYYELLSGITSIISTRIFDEENNKRLKKEANNFNDIINNRIMPIRLMTEYRSSYNEQAVNLFKIDAKYHFELFLREIPLDEADIYKETIKRLFNYPNEVKKMEYTFQDLNIQEYLFAVKVNGEVTIVSFFIDITSKINKEKSLTYNATMDIETGLPNKHSLNLEMEKCLGDKATFILLELDESFRTIYGNERINKFFVEFARATKKHFKEYKVYRYDFNQVIVVLNFNDIRSVNKELADYFQVINHLKSQILKYEKYRVKAGVLRYPVVTIEKSIDKLYRYLDVALDKAKKSKEHDYVHFIYADYEKEVFEQEIIDYLNTAIENKQLSIRFKQIIDIQQNLVWNYESDIYLPTVNIDSKYLKTIAKKRNKIVQLEQFHIEAVCSFLKKLEDETGHLIKLIIPVSKETFLDLGFQGFIIGTLKKYKIPAEFIRILCDLETNDQTAALKVQEMIKFGISLDSTNVETILSNDFNALHLNFNATNNKWKSYYKGLNTFLTSNGIAFVLRNVNLKEEKELIKSLGIKFIEGDLYQKINPSEIITKIKERLV